MKVFVIGHKGLVGSSLLRTAPDYVQVLTQSRDELNLENAQDVFDFIQSEKPDSIILAAAKVGGILANSQQQYEFLLRNLNIQNSVISAAHKSEVQNFIFLGSSCIYPKFARQPVREGSLLTGLLEPTNEGYALAKIAGLRMVQAIFEETGRNFFSLMPTNLYGPNDNFDNKTSHVPAALLRRFHEAKLGNFNSVEVWGSGSPRREFMHVDDLANACWFFISKNLGGRLINIGLGSDISIRDFAFLIARVTGYSGEIQFNSDKPDGSPQKLLDVSQATSLGWKAKIDLDWGLSSTYQWLVKNWGGKSIRGV